MTRASSGEVQKLSTASRGVQTIGSPRVLNEVLTSTGHPGPRLERLEQVVVERVLVTVDGLDSRRAVDVAHGRDPVGLLGPDVVDEEHEGRDPRADEPVGSASSSRTTGATGRKSSRSLISFSRACISAWIGEARIDRDPSARGPNSIRPWNQPITRSCSRIAAASLGDVGQPAIGQLGPAQERLDLVSP